MKPMNAPNCGSGKRRSAAEAQLPADECPLGASFSRREDVAELALGLDADETVPHDRRRRPSRSTGGRRRPPWPWAISAWRWKKIGSGGRTSSLTAVLDRLGFADQKSA
jgi:hypothetical protein